MAGYVPIVALATFALCAIGAVAEAQRSVPTAMPGHPGNVFVVGEQVSAPLPDAKSAWRLVDYDDREIARVAPGVQRAELGALPAGFYRLRREGSSEWVSLAVLEPLKAPTPLTSPIGVDVAMAWFYPEGPMDEVASLAALAGMNYVRDRLAWGHMEPERGRFSAPNQYDASARAQSAAGLRVLQVNHSTPGWAGPVGKRFPPDLRDAYAFYREMARRWKGQVGAFEPWNEADISAFGGHTGAEMAAFQKACYLGLKAGNPNVTASLNVFAAHVRAQLDDLADNRAWPYFDTYNLHHYEGFESYPRLYADHRSVSAGRPLWVTECAMPVKWTGDPKLQEPSDADLKEQSERIAKVFAGSLHEGSRATFYFILGHYVEGQTQFGVIRKDLTPRPAYVALAAAGRLLADARPLGRVKAADGIHAYAFRARPDGHDRVVVVAWAKSGAGVLELPAAPEAVADHLGRARPPAQTLSLTTAPVYAILPSRSASALGIEPSPRSPRRQGGKPSSVVLQPLWPEERTLLWASAYRVSGSEPTEMKLAVYNFSSVPVTGTIRGEAPRGWRVEGLGPISLEPMGRAELSVRLAPVTGSSRTIERFRFVGRFAGEEPAVASIRVAPDSSALAAKPGTALKGADDPQAWELLVSGGPTPTAARDGDGVIFEAAPTGDPWFYPRIKVAGKQAIPGRAVGLAMTVTLLEGAGQFRTIFDEANGASYVCDFVTQPRLGEPVQTVSLFSGAVHGAVWSQPDPNGKLDPGEIATLKIGCNAATPRVRFKIGNVRWVEE